MHSCMTDQVLSRPARTSASGRRTHSFASITWLMRRFWSLQKLSSSVPVRNGYGTGVGSGSSWGCPDSSSSRTNPPPIE